MKQNADAKSNLTKNEKSEELTYNDIKGEIDNPIHQNIDNVKWKRRGTITIYFIAIVLLFSDMNLLAPNLSTVADEFGFEDDERDMKLGGLIALAFFLVGSPVSFIVGWLADSRKRPPLFAFVYFFGELGCFATYFTKDYIGLFTCRIMTGISIGGSIPIVFSVLGDLYKAEERTSMTAVITTGTGVGLVSFSNLIRK